MYNKVEIKGFNHHHDVASGKLPILNLTLDFKNYGFDIELKKIDDYVFDIKVLIVNKHTKDIVSSCIMANVKYDQVMKKLKKHIKKDIKEFKNKKMFEVLRGM